MAEAKEHVGGRVVLAEFDPKAYCQECRYNPLRLLFTSVKNEDPTHLFFRVKAFMSVISAKDQQ